MSRTAKHLDLLLSKVDSSTAFYVWISILVTLVGLGAYAVLMSLIYSLEIFEFSIKIPWGTMVSNYVFLVGSSTGLCIVSSLGLVFGLKRYEPIAKRGFFMALITIIFGMASIMLHLGHPERSPIYSALTPNLRSAMWWMGTVYPPYIAFLAMCFWLLVRQDLAKTARESVGLKAKIYGLMALEGLKAYLYGLLPLERLEAKIYRWLPLEKMGLALDSDGADLRWARIIGALALISGLLAYTVESTLFAHAEARPFWYGALIPVDFFLGAALCGLAWIMAAGIITYKVKGEVIPARLRDLFYEMAQILALLLSVELPFIAYKMGHGLFDPAKGKTIMLLLKGPFSPAFWVFEIAIGIVLPIFILLYAARQKKMTGVLVASVMVLSGYFVKRYVFVVAAQVYPVITKGLPSYLPAFMEVLLIIGIFGGLLLSFTLGEEFLPLKDEDKPLTLRRT